MSKIIVHMNTGTYFALSDEVYVVDTAEFDFDPDEFENDLDACVERYGKPVGVSMRETIPCSNCGMAVWDDDLYQHVHSREFNCDNP